LEQIKKEFPFNPDLTMKKKDFLILPGVVSILLTGGILTALAFQYFRWEIRNSVQQQLEKDAGASTGMITNKVEQYVTLMLSLRNFFKFSEVVTREEFAGFTAILLSQEPGIKTLCWAPHVEQSQRPEYEINARKEGFSTFAFHPDLDFGQQSGTCYFPAYYVEPLDNNSSIFGYVLNSEPLLSGVFEKTIQTGQPASVINPLARITQKPANPKSECWIVIPVLRQCGQSDTEQGRRQCLQGYLIGIIDVSAMIDTLLRNTAGGPLSMKFRIEDVTAGKNQVLTTGGLVCSESGFDKNCHRAATESRLRFTDRTWKIYCIADEQSAFNQNNAWMLWLVFPVGLLLTGLLVLYLYTLYCRNELADNLAEKRTRELKQQKEKADAIALEAERSSRAKSAFLAGMSHDIRTPMNVIMGFCELLAEESLTKDQKDYVHTIHRNSQNLLTLLNDVLDLSKIESGKMHIDYRDCNLHELLNNIQLMFRVSAQNRGLDFRIIEETDILGVIQSDPLRIRQCLENLIGNAIKYTHRGHVYVYVSVEKRKGRLTLAVEDTGIGISEPRLESIFNVFYREDKGFRPESDRGSGLGLAMTRQLARLLGGDVTVQSKIGQGSVFTLEIPVNVMENELHQVVGGAGAYGRWDQI
jgi:signal transduction histidine kinase